MVTFLAIPRHWNTCSDGSAIPEHSERRSKNTRASILSMPLDPPSVYMLMHAPSSVPPNRMYLLPPMPVAYALALMCFVFILASALSLTDNDMRHTVYAYFEIFTYTRLHTHSID